MYVFSWYIGLSALCCRFQWFLISFSASLRLAFLQCKSYTVYTIQYHIILTTLTSLSGCPIEQKPKTKISFLCICIIRNCSTYRYRRTININCKQSLYESTCLSVSESVCLDVFSLTPPKRRTPASWNF